MISLHHCPSTLAEGYNTYSPKALKLLFDGKKVSHIFPTVSPLSNSLEAKEVYDQVGRISLSGVQSKLAVITEKGHFRFTHEGERGTFMLKPKPSASFLYDKDDCPANENLTMQIAMQVYHIPTAANGLVFFQDDDVAYITRRFDVYNGGKYQQEDFASLLGYTKANGGSDYKYCNSSYEECAEVIRKYVKAAAIDVLRFFRLVIFNFIYMNDDAHLKNFSLINTNGEYRLTPAYDLINTSLHIATPRIFALDNGLFKEGMQMSDFKTVSRKDFEEFGRRIGLPERVVKRELDIFSTQYSLTQELIKHSFLSEYNKAMYWRSTDYRRKMLT
jgi:serine/threonine-protein kinase HipA